MEVKDLATLSIFPLCLRADPKTSFAYISNPTLVRKDRGGGERFFLACPPATAREKVQIFYAIIPAYVPIPPEMIVFTAENSLTVPKYTTEVRQERDPNVVVLADRVSFIAWPGAVPYTVPLYLHRLKDKVYPSFNPNHPDIGPKKEWTQELISPIYVIPETVTADGRNFPGYELGFRCYHGSRCILDPHAEESLLDCLNGCAQVPPLENIFDYVRRAFLSKKVSGEHGGTTVKKFFGGAPNWLILSLLTLFFISLAVVIVKSQARRRQGRA